MNTDYLGLQEISGSLVVLEGIASPAYDEIVEITMPVPTPPNRTKTGRVIQIEENRAIVLVFEGTSDLSLTNTRTRFTGRPMELAVSSDILGRMFDGMGRPIDGLGPIYGPRRPINGTAINPVLRTYPKDHIQTGISAIDGLATLIRGQKLPIFSGDGLPHDKLAAQIARQANIEQGENFAVVFAAMGVKYDVADYFRRTFEESGAADRAVMFLNLASDPAVERIITPRCALTAAEYLAFEKEMHVLVILTDMTAYAEALREISSTRGEIPSRKGYPGYLYSDLASLYERAGLLKHGGGSLTQVPILTMPSDDITHPVADLTGYITEGQIVLDRSLHMRGIYPPINILPSLSRLMKDGIGKDRTREDHPALANRLFAAYAQVGDARALASVIGADELSHEDKRLLDFGAKFEKEFVGQGEDESRELTATLDMAIQMLKLT
ncbi:MAG: V-type ATP synthase subunit B [Defluviitaleaceae bacterium]|nr:V-type ATP synthase subunit B [Defluviitaleaceae bacterium]